MAGVAGGAAALGATGGATGLAAGSAVGAALGLVPAIFTFGLSIPVGAAIGGLGGTFFDDFFLGGGRLRREEDVERDCED